VFSETANKMHGRRSREQDLRADLTSILYGSTDARSVMVVWICEFVSMTGMTQDALTGGLTHGGLHII